MPVERKPLFRTEVLVTIAAELRMGPAVELVLEILRKWTRLLKYIRAEELPKSEFLPIDLTDVFYLILDFCGPTATGWRSAIAQAYRNAISTKWETFQGLFRAADQRSGHLSNTGYNDELVAWDQP